jgi:hypothetical protein
MDRFKKLLAAATLLVLPIMAACGEDVMPPPPTGSIVGQVSIEGMGMDGVTVSLSNGASTATAGGGNYRFDNVEQGSYTVTISGFPADASFDATSAPANIGDAGGTVTVDFRGSYIRTASIMGTVTVENTGLGGVTVRLSGMSDAQTATDGNGQYSFTGLRSGTYSVEISGFDSNEVSFSSTSGAATVGVGESKVVSFDGTYLRTAGIQGQVRVDGEGLGGVRVTLMGSGAEETKVTDAGGLYAFSQLRSGDYTVAISGYDADDYEFETTSKSVTIATGETANVPFDGTLLRTAGIAGRVSLDDGMGLDDVAVTLAGAAEATTMTSNGGQYSFAGLAAGTYVVSISNPDANAYSFADDELQKTVELADDQSAIVNFSGTHTRTASVSGVLFIDEVMQDKMLNDGEPTITEAIAPLVAAGALDAAVVAGLLAKAKVKLRGPDLNTMQDIAIMPDGTFSTGASLMAGSYQVELPVNDDDVAAGLAAAGVAFVGESMVVEVAAGGSATANFPFRITLQTVATGARMGGGGHYGPPVAGVELALYARADGTDMLGEATTDEMGMASFTFARADNTGPAGNDNIVFVKVMASGHDALVVSGNDFVEINYASTARLYAADAEKEAATLVNVAVAFDFWVKSNETARDGDMGLGGWNTQVYMGDPEADDAMPLMMEVDGEMVNATMPTNDGKKNMDDLGKSTFAYAVDPTALPATFTVMAGEDDQPDQGEAWEQGDALTHTHTGLEIPSDDVADKGALRVTFTTQAIYVGVHRELDDRTGFTDFIGLGDGDGRPEKDGSAVGEIEITLMTADSRGRLRVLEYDHDADPKTDDAKAVATAGASGMVSFKNIPADTEITVVADEGSGMMIVPDSRSSREIDAFGDQLDNYPDGKIVGAFGDMSGARPDVWLCPLQRQQSDDPNEVCSTYAYKWATGTISGTVSNVRKGDKVTVTLTPVNSNDDYADDLEDEKKITAPGTSASYSFTGVADGRYMATLQANPGSWQADEAPGLSVMHDEGDAATDYTGDTDDTGNLSATDLRGVIRGRIANDTDTPADGLTRDESRAGVVVNLHAASKPDSKGKRTAGADVVATAETDGDGVFMFEGLVVGNSYFLKPQGTDLYTAVRNGDTGVKDEKASDIVTHALTKAGLPPKAGSEPGIPTWNYHTSKATLGDDNNFVLLYKDGEVEGVVLDPSVRARHDRSSIELRQCKVSNQKVNTDGVVTTPGTSCTEYTGVEVEASVDAKGNWSADGLREGLYEVVVDLPPGYGHVNRSGTAATDADPNANPVVLNSYFTQQFVELVGGRADDDTKTFYIKDNNASNASGLTSVEIDGTACTTGGAANHSANQCGHDADGEFSVVVTASPGATVRLSSSAADASASGGKAYSQAVTNGKAEKVTLPEAGTRKYFVHVASQDGYGNNGSAGANDSGAGFNIRRDADVRVKTVTISWGGDRIDLDRTELKLDPDGETKPVTGPTLVEVAAAKGDNNGKIPAGNLSVAATGMTEGFGVVRWGTVDVNVDTIACSGDFDALAVTSGTLTLADDDPDTEDQNEAVNKDGVCFRIADSDGATGENAADKNDNNNRDYILIFTRN